MNAMWMCDLSTFSGCLMGKTREKWHNIMTQMASVLTVTTVFIGLWTNIYIWYSQRRRAYNYMQDKNTYAGILAKNVGGGGGVILCWRLIMNKINVGNLYVSIRILSWSWN